MFSQFFMGIIPESSLSVPKIGLSFLLVLKLKYLKNFFIKILALYFASVIVISAMVRLYI